MKHTTRHPEINVKMVGEDGNAFAILARVRRALLDGGVSKTEVKAFMDEATSGDHDHLLVTVMNWVDVDGSDEAAAFQDQHRDPAAEGFAAARRDNAAAAVIVSTPAEARSAADLSADHRDGKHQRVQDQVHACPLCGGPKREDAAPVLSKSVRKRLAALGRGRDPLDEFIGNVTAISELAEALVEIVDDHFDVDPEAVTWGNVGDSQKTLADLQSILDRIRGQGEWSTDDSTERSS
jgi:hypothetical protein